MIELWIAPIRMLGAILPIMISSGVAGMASRFSYVPRSRSRVSARHVIKTMVMVRMTASSPGMMLYWVMDSGLYRRCATGVNGAGPCARAASGPTRSSRSAVVERLRNAAIA